MRAQEKVEVEDGGVEAGGVVELLASLSTDDDAATPPHTTLGRRDEESLECGRVVLQQPMGHTAQEWVLTHLNLLDRLPANDRNAEYALFQQTLIGLASVAFVETSDDESQLRVVETAEADFNGVPQSAS